MDVKRAICTGDVEALGRLLAEEAGRANDLIRWGTGDCVSTHPLHFVSGMLFEGTLPAGKELPIVEVLLAAGAVVDFHEPGRREAPLMGAASLGAEDVGLYARTPFCRRSRQ